LAIIITQATLERVPATLHFLLTNKCNLNCPKCYYRNSNSEVPISTIHRLFEEWREKGVKAVAIGGGEPFLHPDIGEVISTAKRMGFYFAVTTNGTILPQLETLPDRIHVSYDRIHPTTRREVEEALNHFRNLGVRNIGINHVVTDLEAVREVLSIPCSEVTLLLEKPNPRFRTWDRLVEIIKKNSKQIWLDACLAKLLTMLGHLDLKQPCRQGIYSMSLNSNLEASKCSNVEQKVRYTTIEDAWRNVRRDQRTCLVDWMIEKNMMWHV